MLCDESCLAAVKGSPLTALKETVEDLFGVKTEKKERPLGRNTVLLCFYL